MQHLPPSDRGGVLVAVDNCVRIIGRPDLSNIPDLTRADADAISDFLLGKCKRVHAFSEYGHVELNFRIRGGPLKGLHTVWIEPRYLKVLPD